MRYWLICLVIFLVGIIGLVLFAKSLSPALEHPTTTMVTRNANGKLSFSTPIGDIGPGESVRVIIPVSALVSSTGPVEAKLEWGKATHPGEIVPAQIREAPKE